MERIPLGKLERIPLGKMERIRIPELFPSFMQEGKNIKT